MNNHIVPLSERGESYEVNPTEDLIPVCPNCHVMIHWNGGFFPIDELKKIILGG